MTKSDLIRIVAQRVNSKKKEIKLCINTIFDSMTQALANNEKIEIRGFGSFKTKVRQAKKGKNPKTGQPIDIPAKRIPSFRVGKELKQRLLTKG